MSHQEPRRLFLRAPLTNQEIMDYIFKEDTNDLNNCLIFNGGTGIGKTKQTMTSVKLALTEKHGKSPKMLVVESRSATVDQAHQAYKEEIEGIGGIAVKQRLAFMNMIKNGEVNRYDWIVIDECHGLFSEASFAEDASFIANWINCGRTKQHIIFITANDEYFVSIFKDYFSINFTYSQLFDNMKEYYSTTRVKSANYAIVKSTNQRIKDLLPRLKNKRGIIFLQSASSVKDWYFILLEQGFEPFPMVSLANKTSTQLSTVQEKMLANLKIDMSGGESGLTMADFEYSIDARRKADKKIPVRASIVNNAIIPNDIDILLVTDTLQEGVSIISPIDYIIIEGYTEVEIRQKLGRYRNNLEELYIILNPASVARKLEYEKQQFEMVKQLAQQNNQLQLAKLYGQYQGLKWKKHYITEETINGELHYSLNVAAYQHFLKTQNKYLNSTSQDEYLYNLLSPYVLNPQEDIKKLEAGNFNIANFQNNLNLIIQKWAGIPLKGKAQEELIQDFESYNITDAKNRPVDTFLKCLNMFRRANIEVKEKQASNKDIQKYPEYLSKVREKFKFISI